MVKLIKYIVVIILTILFTMAIVNGSTQSPFYDPQSSIENYPYINQMLFESSRYTQKEDVDPQVLNTYLNTYQLSFTQAQLDQLGFVQMVENSEIIVYFEPDSFSMIVKNKTTGYFWSSRPEFQGTSGEREDNTANRNLMNSGLWIEYVNANRVSSSTIVLQSLYSLAGVSYANDGSITVENPDPLRPYEIVENSYDTKKVETTIKDQHANGFSVAVDVKTIQFTFEVSISVENASIEVFIDQQLIKENNPNFSVLAIQVFPFFGAAREDKIPGYIMIPDGIGALVRTNQRYNTYFQARFYGSDMGFAQSMAPHLSLPIFGVAHQANHNAFMVHIIEGAQTSQLRAQFWGSGTRYHRITSRYGLRTIYYHVINKAGDGYDTVRPEITESNYKMAYHFLSNDEANYVGMATKYRDYLIENDMLTQREKSIGQDIPMHVSYIISEQEPSFFGTSRLNMTSYDDVLNSYEHLREMGVTNQQIKLYGWSKDGFVYRQPYRVNVFDRNDFNQLVDNVLEDDNTIYLDNDYVFSSELSHRINYNKDVARSISRLKLSFNRRMLNGRLIQMYYLIPERSLTLAKQDVSNINKLSVSGLSMDFMGNTLFSHYDGKFYQRNSSVDTYKEIASLYDGLLLSNPNDYLFEYMTGYLNMPITNSQFDYYTDLVPLIPIVLKGSVSYYTPYLNFNALAEDRLLSLVDFGMNPSYVLTEKPTYEMRYTLANRFFTTTRSDYEKEMVDVYHYVNDALKHVSGAYIENREIIETGFVKVTYSNGVSIYVNYNFQSKTHLGQTIAPRHYVVVTS